jgi:hypothetical protein
MCPCAGARRRPARGAARCACPEILRTTGAAGAQAAEELAASSPDAAARLAERICARIGAAQLGPDGTARLLRLAVSLDRPALLPGVLGSAGALGFAVEPVAGTGGALGSDGGSEAAGPALIRNVCAQEAAEALAGALRRFGWAALEGWGPWHDRTIGGGGAASAADEVGVRVNQAGFEHSVWLLPAGPGAPAGGQPTVYPSFEALAADRLDPAAPAAGGRAGVAALARRLAPLLRVHVGKEREAMAARLLMAAGDLADAELGAVVLGEMVVR